MSLPPPILHLGHRTCQLRHAHRGVRGAADPTPFHLHKWCHLKPSYRELDSLENDEVKTVMLLRGSLAPKTQQEIN